MAYRCLTAGLGRLKLASGIFYGLLPASCLPSCQVVVASRKNVVSAGDVHQGYGSGIVHTMYQNERQLPRRVASSGGVLDYEYYYDPNGNPTHIANMLVPDYDPLDRWMGFDGLDRLTVAASVSFGGDHWVSA
jgi:hypothetical protein